MAHVKAPQDLNALNDAIRHRLEPITLRLLSLLDLRLAGRPVDDNAVKAVRENLEQAKREIHAAILSETSWPDGAIRNVPRLVRSIHEGLPDPEALKVPGERELLAVARFLEALPPRRGCA